MTLTTGALGALAAAFVAYVITWLASFMVHLLNAPVTLFHEQKERADRLDELKQLAIGATRAPSFDLGFELLEIDATSIEKFHGGHGTFSRCLETQEICRIWVENLANHAVADCGIIIEDFRPDSPVKNGVMLVPDNRGAEEQQSVQFHLAATQRRYFKFLRLSDVDGELKVLIKSDQDHTGFLGVLDRAALDFGKKYFTTIAVHGRNANSRRISLTIDVINEREIVVANASSTQYKELGIAQ